MAREMWEGEAPCVVASEERVGNLPYRWSEGVETAQKVSSRVGRERIGRWRVKLKDDDDVAAAARAGMRSSRSMMEGEK